MVVTVAVFVAARVLVAVRWRLAVLPEVAFVIVCTGAAAVGVHVFCGVSVFSHAAVILV